MAKEREKEYKPFNNHEESGENSRFLELYPSF